MTLIDKTFDPAAIEAHWYPHWEQTGAFRPARPDAKPYTIIIPPPNVTGSLHIGHALDNSLQDVLIRYHRLRGHDARWVVGTDHAGIATQMVVERQLAEAGKPDRKAMGRADFLKTVWDWKAESGGRITNQLRRLGASCDWENERFTMDDGFSAAVTKVFVALYRQKLLYRDKRLVNWDPKLGTAISDLEVETREVAGTFTHIRYPLADGVRLADGSDHVVVATTRPETMLGDTAVAVNAADERYQSVIGKEIVLPITGRRIPIVADDHADPELGSGAVKITPAHDFNDFEVGKRAGLPMINVLDATAHICAAPGVPADYVGLDRFEARKKIVADLEALDLVALIEAKTIQMPYGDRSGVVIEPWLTDQWYVDAHALAQPALAAVRDGRTKFVPATWEKTYFNWLDNIQPWCVSRQLWWGHRIPAWYGPDGSVFVAETEAEAQSLAGAGVALVRDEDVLDTWFSSALWPFGTLGWPENTPELARHYPGDVLVTGFDIIFFWVARMMMQGLHFMDQVPFHTVYCHGLVRDAKGQKMSKSKGNTVDPLTLIDRYGADALRFTLTAMETQGRDIKLDEKRVEGYRNFATKLWNAARFAQSNGIVGQPKSPPEAQNAINRWIISEVSQTVEVLETSIESYRFDVYADTLYQFIWSRFCDWYLELTKPLLAEGADEALAEETRCTAGWALDQILIMLHPVMPFLTEELWHKLGTRPHDLILASWPDIAELPRDAAACAEMDWLIGLVNQVRSARTELNVPASAQLTMRVLRHDDLFLQRLNNFGSQISRLARIKFVGIVSYGLGIVTLNDMNSFDMYEYLATHGDNIDGVSFQIVIGETELAFPLEGVIDIAAERARLEKARDAAAKDRDGLAGRLASPGFTEKAKPEAVEKARADHAARAEEAERLGAALARLG